VIKSIETKSTNQKRPSTLTMHDDAGAERGDDEDSFILDSVFPVSRQSPSHPSSHHAYYIIQEPLRPPSPEPTTAVYQRSVAGTIAAGMPHASWSTITVRVVGSHPLWGHYLCVHACPLTPTQTSTISGIQVERRARTHIVPRAVSRALYRARRARARRRAQASPDFSPPRLVRETCVPPPPSLYKKCLLLSWV